MRTVSRIVVLLLWLAEAEICQLKRPANEETEKPKAEQNDVTSRKNTKEFLRIYARQGLEYKAPTPNH